MKTQKVLTDKEAGFIVDTIKEKRGLVLLELIERSGSVIRWKDLLRFMPASERCRKMREEKGLSIKKTAASLKVPQYTLKAIEGGRCVAVRRDIVDRYIDFLGLREWFNQWIEENRDVYDRLAERWKA